MPQSDCNARAISHLDPARIDTDLLLRLFEQYGDARFRADLAGLRESFTRLERWDEEPLRS